jgi:3',5'-cyclic-AMP phosphodiesterase
LPSHPKETPMQHKVVTFVHITDLHIGDRATDKHLYSDTSANLEAFKRVIAQLDPQPSFVLATGDLANDGDEESYRKLRALMADIEAPVFYALGNHDSKRGRQAFYSGMFDRAEDGEKYYDYDHLVDGVHLIVLDTTETGKVGGSLTEAQFEWLGAALERHPEERKLLALHHGPAFVEDPDMEWESLRWADSERLAAALAGYEVLGIMCGHLHSDRVTSWHGIPVVMSTGPHMALDPAYTQGGLKMVEGTSFGLCRVLPNGLMVNFVPMPATRAEIATHTPERVREMMKKYTQAAAE